MTNENEKTAYQNLWYALKVLKGKFTAVNTHTKKRRKI
jgi:hypothetical protein